MKRIVLLLVMPLFFLEIMAQVTISGLVINQIGEPLIGANVTIKESFKGVATNSEGVFKFSKLKPQTYTILISYLGYNTLEEVIDIRNEQNFEFVLLPSSILSEDVIVKATRVSKNDPVSFSSIDKNELKENNFGQDVSYLISRTPSIVQTSDAGTGIGYTYFRIRGTDMNRINITVNGIPLNDSESHGVWWVNMPDFISSVDNVQIQRGVGTSTNGAAAFGATLNLQTKTFNKDPYAEINSFAGSFNTYKNSVSFGTGLINNKFTFDGRYSTITSNGFIDRASSNLSSYYLSGAYYSSKSLLKINVISGKEKTYQAWNGVPKVRLENDTAGMRLYLDHWLIDNDEYINMVNSNNRTYNLYTYENETDNYQQNHYQLFYSYEINQNLNLNTAFHYTQGKGYYEQYKKDRDLTDYNLDPVILTSDTIETTDLIQQKWLDNHFYGFVFSAEYSKEKLNISVGGSWNQYLGDHYGEVIWAQYASNSNIRYRWYSSNGDKKDFTVYGKAKYLLFNKFNVYLDLQYRKINYIIDGIDYDLRDIGQTHTFNFFNPKAGIFYQINDIHSLYATYGVANREPNRSNYTDAGPGQKPVYETLYNYELGYDLNKSRVYVTANIYYMDYKNQLVLTGQINDVGSPIMVNVDKSYRLGFEFSVGLKPVKRLELSLNTTISKNNIMDFTEYIDNWDTWGQDTKNLGTSDLSFSPKIIANGNISFNILKNLKTEFVSKYVSRQFIDNTSNRDRSIDPYFVTDLRISYSFKTKLIKEIKLNLLINNLFNHEYESNAWVYKYKYGGENYVMDGYFPQAGINFIGGLTIGF